MLDYLNWYLVELERNLRGKRNSQAVADFLVESRSHLTERIDDLVARGIDPVSATKASIIDFGDPQAVAQAYQGRRYVSATVRGVGIALAIILGLAIMPAFFVAMLDLPNLHEGPLVSGLIWTASLSFFVVGWLSWKTRTWISLPVGAFAVSIALVASVVFTSMTGLANLNGQAVHVFLPHRQDQIEARSDWLARYEIDVAKLNAWRASDRGPKADELLNELAGPLSLAPVVSYQPRHSNRMMVLPSDSFPSARVVLDSGYGPIYRLESHFNVADVTRTAWQTHGDAYANYLSKQRARVELELNALSNLTPSSFSQRWTRHGYQAAAMIGIGSLFAVLLNGVILMFASASDTMRRRRWRRQVG